MLPIEVTSLKKHYGDLKAVDGISFTVKEGEVFGLLGPNGAGKTTCIEIMEGLRERDGGEVKVLGLDPWKNGYQLHQKIGVIPQDFTFFEKTTPREAIIYYADLFNVKVDPDEILREVLLEDSAKVHFDNLSGGQKQKTGLALSLVNSPELLFLDEPTTGLDPNARRAIWEVIRGLKAKGKTIILTTHYLDEGTATRRQSSYHESWKNSCHGNLRRNHQPTRFRRTIGNSRQRKSRRLHQSKHRSAG